MVVAVVLVGVACASAAGCYRPGFEDCQLTCSAAAEASCPDGLVCAAGRCRTDELAPACPQGPTDAGEDTADASGEDAIDAFVADAHPEAPDAAPQPDASCTCDPLSQSCCTAEDACDLTAGSAFCRDVTAAGMQAAVCSSPTECARGYSCMNGAGSPPGSCHEFCDADGDCAGGGLCDLLASASTTKVCTTACNPPTAAGCPEGSACQAAPNAEASRWHTDCRPAGPGGGGAACTSNDSCKIGFACVGAPLRCRKYCNLGAPGGSACPGQDECIALGTGVLDGTEWGVCM